MTLTPKKRSALPALWYKSILKKQAEQEEMRIITLQHTWEALSRLDKTYQWDEAYLFGSVVQQGKFGRNSDIDIAIRGLKRLEYYAFVGEISDLLDKRVDVVLLEECQFVDSIKEKGIRWNRKSKL